ncbi:AAA family ATPase [Formosa undariae]|uniref:AAA family ATPase n=1 Tax=Formosa undariae TaxID=1325436 RepID=A0ABV5F3H7_9FLAO
MRINKLYIHKYKNLKEFKIDFSNSYYISVLLGKNGTGKSNFFEFLTIVFKCLDLADSPAAFKEFFKNELQSMSEVYTDFSLDYTINSNKIRIVLEGNDLKIRDVIRTSSIPFSQFSSKKEQLFPSHVIGYYSGRNGRFEGLFDKHIVDAEQAIIDVKNAQDKKDDQELKAYQEEIIIPEKDKVIIPEEIFRNLFFAKHQYSQLLLLTLFAFKNKNSAIDVLLKEYLKIDGFQQFSLTLKSPKFNSKISYDDGVEKFWGAAGSALDSASFLYRISKRYLILPIEQVNAMNIKSSKKEAITFLVNAEKFIEEVTAEYKHDMAETFRHLESLYLSDLLQEIVLDVKRGEDIISFSNLSEGEQQMIATLGLMIITGTKNSLYLLDEPDTHLNPKWQREYINIIKQMAKEDDNSHIMIGTHSPFIPQSVVASDLILFKKIDQKTEVRKLDNMHTWKIDQILTSEIYELETTRASDIEYAITRRDQLRSLVRELKGNELEELREIESTIEDLGVGRTSYEVKLNERMKKLSEIFSKVDKS